MALNPGRSVHSLSPGWRHSLRPLVPGPFAEGIIR